MKRLRFCLLSLIVFNFYVLSAREFHVSVKGNDSGDGSSLKPFKTIGIAVQHAFAGDTITVHGGTYREWVNPLRGGESDVKRIVYRAAPGEKAEIKGSEIITGWKKVKDGVWKAVIPNSLFGDYNPYQDSVFGDWFYRMGRIHHTGEVFLNGKSLYEKETLDKVLNPIPDTKIKDTEGSTYTWYCESDQNNITIWANFQKFNPNKELAEITARRTCFYPEKPGINYITISGFHISQAATQWAAPTAEQTGICGSMGAAFSTIENNHIYNIWTKRQFDGAEIAGIKFHAAIDATIRKNRIHDCGRVLWFDWMTQGTRISSNLLYNNDLEDLFFEVDHGPFLVDNNIMLSHSSIRTQSEGGAYVHNLIAGTVYMWSEPNRFTPYFLPHSTEVAGLSTIYSGDDRYYNNIFIGNGEKPDCKSKHKYGLEEYNKAVLPVWMSGNIFYNGAKPCDKEKDNPESSGYNPEVKLVEKGDNVFLQFGFNQKFYGLKGDFITT